MGRSCIQHSDLAIDIRTTLGAPVHVAVVHNVRRAVSIVVLEEVKVAVQRLRNTHILLHNRKRPSHVDDLLRVSRNTQFLNCTRKEGVQVGHVAVQTVVHVIWEYTFTALDVGAQMQTLLTPRVCSPLRQCNIQARLALAFES